MSDYLVKLSGLHPLWLTAIFVSNYFMTPLAFNRDPGLASSAVIAFICGASLVVIGWAHGIYISAQRKMGIADGHKIDDTQAVVFWVAEVSTIILAVFAVARGIDTDEGVSAIQRALVTLAALSYIAAFWKAASALVASENGVEKPKARSVLGTFLLMFYYVVGAWVIRRRVLALAR